MNLNTCNSTLGNYLNRELERQRRRRHEEEMMLENRRYGMPRFEPSILEFGCDFSNKEPITFKGLFNCIEEATKKPEAEQEATREELFFERDILSEALDSAYQEIDSLKIISDNHEFYNKRLAEKIEELDKAYSKLNEENQGLRNQLVAADQKLNNIITQLINRK